MVEGFPPQLWFVLLGQGKQCVYARYVYLHGWVETIPQLPVPVYDGTFYGVVVGAQ